MNIYAIVSCYASIGKFIIFIAAVAILSQTKYQTGEYQPGKVCQQPFIRLLKFEDHGIQKNRFTLRLCIIIYLSIISTAKNGQLR